MFEVEPRPPLSLSRRIIADVEILIATVAPVFCCHPRPELFLSELEIGSRHVLKQLPRQLRDSKGFCFFQQTRQSAGINNFRVKSWLQLFFSIVSTARTNFKLSHNRHLTRHLKLQIGSNVSVRNRSTLCNFNRGLCGCNADHVVMVQ